jgi:integrase
MSVYKQPGGTTYRYDFVYKGIRHLGTTEQTILKDAIAVEADKKRELRQRAGGLIPPSIADTPRFAEFARVALHYQTQYIKRPEILERTLRMVLAFWGAPPKTPIGPAAVPRAEAAPRPYHNLRLGDPIADPTWLARFDEWMEARQIGASCRNSYLSACSDIYACAMQPKFRPTTGITTNPFEGIRRSRPRTRTVTLAPDEILALVSTAGRHIAAALCIAALAPKLRVATILKLKWATHFDAELTTITVTDHKTSDSTGAQTLPVSAQLREILTDIRAFQTRRAARTGTKASPYVITYAGEPVASIKRGLRRAVESIGRTWGLKSGVTFHVMRHSMATMLANPHLMGGAVGERLRADVMGHKEIRTTQKYTHLNTAVQEGPHEALSAALPGLRAAATRSAGPSSSSVALARSSGKSSGTQSPVINKTLHKLHISIVRPDVRKRA